MNWSSGDIHTLRLNKLFDYFIYKFIFNTLLFTKHVQVKFNITLKKNTESK